MGNECGYYEMSRVGVAITRKHVFMLTSFHNMFILHH